MKYTYIGAIALIFLSGSFVHAETRPLMKAAVTGRVELEARKGTSTPMRPAASIENNVRPALASTGPVRPGPIGEKDTHPVATALMRGIQNQYAVMIARFDATIARLSGLIGRLDSRITKIKAAGKDTTVADGYVLSAKTELEAAKTSFATMQISADATATTTSSVGTTTPFKTAKEALAALKKATNETEKHLASSYTYILKTISALKKIDGGVNATTSETNI